jgi:hypothetical protein
MPILKVISMTNETSLADFLCHVFIICGMNENVVNVAAINPKIVIKSIILQPFNALPDIQQILQLQNLLVILLEIQP